jgi:hypothetical protein
MAIVLELIEAKIEVFHSSVETGSRHAKPPTHSSRKDEHRGVGLYLPTASRDSNCPDRSTQRLTRAV